MNYEIVQIEEKIVAGLRIRTSNSDPTMPKAIGMLWQDFFTKGVYPLIPFKQNDKTLGVYSNYESDASGAYDVMVCCEVSNAAELPSGVDAQMIPAGKYAKFVVQGDAQKAVADFWVKLWSMDLDRAYSCDFEEYQPGSNQNHAEIHIYIGLN